MHNGDTREREREREREIKDNVKICIKVRITLFDFKDIFTKYGQLLYLNRNKYSEQNSLFFLGKPS